VCLNYLDEGIGTWTTGRAQSMVVRSLLGNWSWEALGFKKTPCDWEELCGGKEGKDERDAIKGLGTAL